MAKDLVLPVAISVAVATDRVEVLRMANIADFSNEDVRKLLGELLEDRGKLRCEVVKCRDALKEIFNGVRAAYNKWDTLLNVLDGVDPSQETPSALDDE